jgi:1L-myo-inositol 1-phosphate cytidylyltransferase / CDP-L-myo-inositol myo-inositolphosphotransferase
MTRAGADGRKGHNITDRAIIVFSSKTNAEQLVAGLPAAARAVREAALAGIGDCTVTVPDGWSPNPTCRAEIERLAAGMKVDFATEQQAVASADPAALLISGERQILADDLRLLMNRSETEAGVGRAGSADSQLLAQLRDGGGTAALAAAERRIIAATGKSSDGIVSRHINRPISQVISRLLLRYPPIRPVHGTLMTAAIAIIMLYFLLQGTQQGLAIGAILFQLASIIDGVDGEIARATFRSTPKGAMVDSLIDAAANLGFIAGVTLNLYMQNEFTAAKAGAAGLAMLAAGLTLIGFRGRKNEAGLTFNGVKEHFSAQRSRVMTWLTWLTMRDFFALVGAVLILAGFGPQALILFAVVTTGWLAVVMAVMFRQAT